MFYLFNNSGNRFVTKWVVALFLFMFNGLTYGSIIHVPGDTTSIQGGIDLAVDGDTVLVADGHYYENIDFSGKAIMLASRFLMDGDSLHIIETIIDGSLPVNPDSASVVYFLSGEDSTSVINGFTITGGSGTYLELDDWKGRIAGGIFLEYCGAKIINNRIIDNHVSDPDDIYVLSGGLALYPLEGYHVIVRNNIIMNNTVNGWWGGGAALTISAYGNTVIQGNRILNNSHTAERVSGGGVYLYGGNPDHQLGELKLIDNIIKGNSTQSMSGYLTSAYGGGIYVENCSPFIANNIISDNRAAVGGGLCVSTWSGLANPSQPVFINNTIVRNTANFGGGVYVTEEANTSHPLLLNNIIWNNLSVEVPGESQIYRVSGNVTVRHCNVQGGYEGAGNVNFTPCFADTHFHLADSSICIGGGIASFEFNETVWNAPETDAEGNVRPAAIDAYIDMGALESFYRATPKPGQLRLLSKSNYFDPSTDSPPLTLELFNPHAEDVQVFAHLQWHDSTAIAATMELHDDGMHNDGDVNDNVYGGAFAPVEAEGLFDVMISMRNNTHGNTITAKDPVMLTTIGPVELDHFEYARDSVPNPGDFIYLSLFLKNNGDSASADNISATLTCPDTLAETRFSYATSDFETINPGEIVCCKRYYIIRISEGPFPYMPYELKLPLDIQVHHQNKAGNIIQHDYYSCWKDTLSIIIQTVGMEEENILIPIKNSLHQNYPNPFNPVTAIRYSITAFSKVELSIYNVKGQKVHTLVKEKQPAGVYTVEWNASNFASGVYFYKLITDQGFIETRKLILLR